MTDTIMTRDNCPFTVTVLGERGSRNWRIAVSVPESSAPEYHDLQNCQRCIAEECGEESTASHLYVRDHGAATWPTDKRIAAEASRQCGTVREDGRRCDVALGADRVTVAYVPGYQRAQAHAGGACDGVEEQAECSPSCAAQLVAEQPRWTKIA